jgi:hypothetical protein
MDAARAVVVRAAAEAELVAAPACPLAARHVVAAAALLYPVFALGTAHRTLALKVLEERDLI